MIIIYTVHSMSFTTSDKKYAQKNQKPSKVLLVCVYDTVVFEITNELIRSKFQNFGKIIKLLIFQKGEVTKFFIEYEELEQAQAVKKALDGVKLYGTLCKMSIYFSNFANVDLKHEQSQNLFMQDYKQLYELEDHTKSTNKQKKQYADFIDDDPLLRAFGAFGGFDDSHRSKTDNPRTLQQQIMKMSNSNSNHYQRQNEELQHSIKQSIDSILGISPSIESPTKKQSGLKMKEQSDIRSSVLYFNYKYSIKPSCIYNLFSNFGNLSCVIIKKNYVYIKLRSKEFAAIVSTYLNNTVLSGNIMQLRQCSEISDVWKPTQNQYCEAIYYDPSFDRFTPQRSITINPPSQTIHVSSMKKQICKENVLRDIFEQFGNVTKIHILQQSNQRNMALVKFSSTEESFNAIANLHNESFSGRKMQISFTKSKI